MFAVGWLTVGIKLHYQIQWKSLNPPPSSLLQITVFQQWGGGERCVTAVKPHSKLTCLSHFAGGRRSERNAATDEASALLRLSRRSRGRRDDCLARSAHSRSLAPTELFFCPALLTFLLWLPR